MKVSVNWISSVTEQYKTSANLIPKNIDELVEKIGAQLGAVEEVTDTSKVYQGILIVKVVECQKHPNADKLSLCLVDDGGVNKKVKRNEHGLIQVVCGAPNVKAGMLAVWIPPGIAVPSTFDKDPFVIETRDIRGVTSHGMLASAKELDIGDDHSGIIEIDKTAKAGDDFAELYKMNDHIIDIENKMFTHRPDLFGHLGIARELAGIQNQVFKSPDWYSEDAVLRTDGRNNGLTLEVKNSLPKLVPRFCAVAIKDVKVEPSPLWLRASLSRLGVKSINNIVDLTNFYMLLTAQPLHAYDYDKVKTGVLGVRMSKKVEMLTLLGNKEIKLDEETVVITDGNKPIGLAGVMGGAGTEVDNKTKNIILEVANFDMNQTRKTAMHYGLFTDAATRFTKNQSPRQNRAVIVKATDDILRIAGGRIASKLVDDKNFEVREKAVKTTVGFINSRLGLNLGGSEIKKLLENVEFLVNISSSSLTVTAPFWRTDIEIPEDVVEEVGRLYGYDHLPLELPSKNLAPAQRDVPLDFKSELRNILISAGSNEVLTYSFVDEKLLKAAGQDPKDAYHIRNAISPDLQYYRLNLLPSLLEKVRPNVKNGYDSFTIFEIGKGHVKGVLDEEKLPLETEYVAGVAVNPYPKGAPYYQARIISDYLFQRLHISDITLRTLTEVKPNFKTSVLNCYEPSRTAVVWSDKHALGLIGEPSQNLRTALKLPAGTSMFEFEIPNLYDSSNLMTYRELNRFPEISEDICLKLPVNISYEEADKFVWNEIQKQAEKHGYNYEMETLDIFQRENDKSHKQITWRIVLSHPERTLTTQEANKVLDELAAKAKKELKAERI
jgi:phenylalanyl-tRNA synthetase beta chain